MNNLKKAIRVIANFQTKKEIYRGKNDWFTSVKWFLARSIRNVSIVGMFVLTGYVSAKTYNSVHPYTVYADRIITNTVVASSTEEFPPILSKICIAESSGKQFLSNGSVVRGKVNPSDIGICQINEPIWNDKARKLGYDIYTEQGNKDMALWIFVNYGTDPWNSSKVNWK